MIDKMLKDLEREKKRVQQEKMQLKRTRACVKIYRDAIFYMWSPELITECYKLVEDAARSDWGPDTIVDDFNHHPRLAIINGRMSEII